jgi:hypothetical protein
MNPLKLDIGYLYRDDEKKGIFNLELISDIPFYTAGHRWNIRFDNIFGYTNNEPLYYKNISGISVDLPIGFTTLKSTVSKPLLTLKTEQVLYTYFSLLML